MNINALATLPNLRLAWRRITTGGNYQYKRYFRHLYSAYELALDDNLKDLRSRLLALSWQPSSPDRIYLPKPSGLQRPLTLLHLEDQIVLQALANVVAAKIARRRRQYVYKTVFSNIQQPLVSIFFVEKWQVTYAAFSAQVEKHFYSGRTWVADFDLAAFYETISHDLLLRTAFPRSRQTESMTWLRGCLSAWTSARPANSLGHGLPQGPIASDFLAEAFLLPVDEAMGLATGYVRYVDDVRLFAHSEDVLRKRVIQLEIHCRDRGLIPQVGKFHIRQAHSINDARAMLPSVGAARDTTDPRLTKALAERLVRAAIGGRPLRVVDKTRFRYVFYRAKASPMLLRLACTLLPRNPEHVDALVAYLAQYGYRKSLRDCCLAVLAKTPYEYVQGELWHILARFYGHPVAFDAAVRRRLRKRAVDVLLDKKATTAVKWGAAHFVCAAEVFDHKPHTRHLGRQSSAILQALVAPVLPSAALKKTGVSRRFLSRTAIEPGVALAGPLHAAGLSTVDLGIAEATLPRQVRHVFSRLGLLPRPARRVDVVSEILQRRYGAAAGGRWKQLLGPEYLHATGILVQADSAFTSAPSYWLSHQNSFNQTVFLALQRRLMAIGGQGAVRTRNATGELFDYGVTLDKNNAFSRAHPTIADCFREMNSRRNKMPGSHPYEKRTAAQTKFLTSQERNRMVGLLRAAYTEIANRFVT